MNKIPFLVEFGVYDGNELKVKQKVIVMADNFESADEWAKIEARKTDYLDGHPFSRVNKTLML